MEDAFYSNCDFCYSSVCNDFVTKELTNSEIEMYIGNMRPNQCVGSDVSSIQLVKLSSKVIASYICKLFDNIGMVE